MTASLYTQGLQQNCRSTYKTWQVHKLPYANGIAFPVLLARGTEKKLQETIKTYSVCTCLLLTTWAAQELEAPANNNEQVHNHHKDL